MKSQTEKKIVVSESRKIRKPLMEKKRRARINDSLETLKQILLDSKTTTTAERRNGQKTAKLEKADILEMTVRYVQHLRNKLNQCENVKEVKICDNSTDGVKMGVTLIPTKLTNGDIVFVMPGSLKEKTTKIGEDVWRPW